MGDKETLPVSNGNAEEATVQNDANSRVQEDLDVDRAKALEDEIKDTFKGREKNRLICKGFMAKQKFTRKDLLRVPQVYTSYTALHSFYYTRIVFFEVSLALILRNWKNEPQNILPIFLVFDET